MHKFLPFFFTSLGLLSGLHVPAQVVVRLDVAADSLWVGAPIEVRLEIRHDPAMVVVFPQGAKAFFPFEVVSAQAEPTETLAGTSRDASTYVLRTFDLAPRQALSLPYGYLEGRDTVWRRVRSDSLPLHRSVPDPVDSTLTYRHGKDLLAWQAPPNYTGLMLILAGALFALGGLVVLLRRPLRRYLALNRFRREWQHLRRELARLSRLPSQEARFAQINPLWRAYLDPTGSLGLASMTTTELRAAIPRLSFLNWPQQQVLLELAAETDRVLYAGLPLPEAQTQELLRRLREVLAVAYQARRRHL